MSEKKWHIVFIHTPRNVKVVKDVFDKSGLNYSIWMPEQEVIEKENPSVDHQRARGRHAKEGPTRRPIFYGYVFVNFAYPGSSIDTDLADAKAGFLLKAPGASLPTEVDEETIERIKRLERIKVLPELDDDRFFSMGETVEITNGPFLSSRGTVIGLKRSALLVEFDLFGRTVTMEIDKKSAKKVTREEEGADA